MRRITNNRAILEALKNNVPFSYRKVCYIGQPCGFDLLTI